MGYGGGRQCSRLQIKSDVVESSVHSSEERVSGDIDIAEDVVIRAIAEVSIGRNGEETGWWILNFCTFVGKGCCTY